MVEIVLLGLVGVAVLFAGRYAYLYAHLKRDVFDLRRLVDSQVRVILALKMAIERQVEFGKVLDEIHEADTAGEFNELYFKLLKLPLKQDAE